MRFLERITRVDGAISTVRLLKNTAGEYIVVYFRTKAPKFPASGF